MFSSVRSDRLREAFDPEGGDVDRRSPVQVEVAYRLADRGSLQEAVPGEPGRVQEPEAVGLGLADHRVAVGGDLVQPAQPCANATSASDGANVARAPGVARANR